MGRFKHEGANVIVSRSGHVAAYMGDDERFDYLYKFVSEKRYRHGDRRHNLSLLESGTLYVAKLTGDSPAAEIDGSGQLPSDGMFDGTGRWIKLASGGRSFVPGMTIEEVLTFTRLAGDAVGATKMDRPEDIQRNPVNGRVYVNLTNNTARTPAQTDPPTPVAPTRGVTCWRSARTVTTPTRPPSPGASSCSAATRTTPARTSPVIPRTRSALSARPTT
jgi:secreted PhoX family phosphatase